jgi:hypothetical protein
LKNSNGQVADGSKVHPRRDDDSAIVAPDRSPGLGSPRPGRRGGCMAQLPETIKAGIVAMVKASTEKG